MVWDSEPGLLCAPRVVRLPPPIAAINTAHNEVGVEFPRSHDLPGGQATVEQRLAGHVPLEGIGPQRVLPAGRWIYLPARKS